MPEEKKEKKICYKCNQEIRSRHYMIVEPFNDGSGSKLLPVAYTHAENECPIKESPDDQTEKTCFICDLPISKDAQYKEVALIDKGEFVSPPMGYTHFPKCPEREPATQFELVIRVKHYATAKSLKRRVDRFDIHEDAQIRAVKES